MNKNKIDKLVESIRSSFSTCVDNTRTHGGYEMWEDYDMIALPESLTPEETKELIDKVQSFLHYCNWADLPTIIEEAKTARSVMIYVDDTSSWWRFEA
jgi:hypothetical protein